MGVKVPIDLTAAGKPDLYNEGLHRARIGKAGIYPKDTELGPDGDVPGATTSKGTQAYGRIRVGFVFGEHNSNFQVNDDGDAVSVAGKWIWENFSFHPNQRRFMSELFSAAGVVIEKAGVTEEMLADLLGRDVDINIKTKAQYDNPDIPESRVTGVRPALDG